MIQNITVGTGIRWEMKEWKKEIWRSEKAPSNEKVIA